jgi:uncharacterized membrane protein
MNFLKATTPPLIVIGLGFILTFVFNVPWFLSFLPMLIGAAVTVGLFILTFFSVYMVDKENEN